MAQEALQVLKILDGLVSLLRFLSEPSSSQRSSQPAL